MSLNWLRKLLGDAPPCEACEALKSEVEHLRYQNKRFMDNLLIKPEPETAKEPVPITRPKTVPWPVRKAQLEREDREKAERIRAEAKASRDAAKPNTIETADLEREMGIVEQEREHGA